MQESKAFMEIKSDKRGGPGFLIPRVTHSCTASTQGRSSLSLVTIGILALFADDPIRMGVIFLFIAGIAVFSRLGIQFMRAVVMAAPLVIFVVVLDLFFGGYATGVVYYSADLWIFHPALTSDRIVFACTMGLRLLSIATFSILFVVTTDYNSFVQGLKRMKFPGMLSFSLGYALKSTTALSEDLKNIMDAQRSRGMEFDKNLVLKQRNKLMAVSIPLSVSVLRRSKQVSDAMLCRGYGANPVTTNYSRIAFGKDDYLMGVLCVMLVVVVFVSGLFPVFP